MIVLLAGRRGAGKTTLATALTAHGFARVHTTSVAAAHGIAADPDGVFHGLAEPLGATILRAGPLVVVDGSPRTIEQAELVDTLSASRPCLIVELVASEALSRARMTARGNTPSSIERAQARWGLEAMALNGFSPLRLDATDPVETHLHAVLARALRLPVGTL